MDARQYAALPDPFPMWRGGVLHGARIAYETWGTLNAARDNALLLFTGSLPAGACRVIRAGSERRAGGRAWWGRSSPSTPSASSSSASTRSAAASARAVPPRSDPATGQPYRLRFPDLSIEDIARAGLRDRALARHHAPRHRHGALARRHGSARVRGALPASRAAAGVHLWHRGGRRLCDCAALHPARDRSSSDPAWAAGDYTPERPPVIGQRLARKLGTVTYRSAAEWQQRFGREPIRADMLQRVSLRLRVRGAGLSREPGAALRDAPSMRTATSTSRALWIASTSPLHGDPVALFRRANLEQALVIGVQSDLLFSVSEQQAVARLARRPPMLRRTSCRSLHPGP